MTHWFERVHVRPLRKVAMKHAEKWMLDHFERSDGLGAIYPAMLNAIVALRCLGYSFDDPQMIRAMDEFEKLGIDCPNGEPGYPTPTFRMQFRASRRCGIRRRCCRRWASAGFRGRIRGW